MNTELFFTPAESQHSDQVFNDPLQLHRRGQQRRARDLHRQHPHRQRGDDRQRHQSFWNLLGRRSICSSKYCRL